MISLLAANLRQIFMKYDIQLVEPKRPGIVIEAKTMAEAIKRGRLWVRHTKWSEEIGFVRLLIAGADGNLAKRKVDVDRFRPKPRLARNEIHKHPQMAKVTYTLKDGLQIQYAHERDAYVVMKGFCLMTGVKNFEMWGDKFPDLPVKLLLKRCGNTYDKAKERAAGKYVAKHFKFCKKDAKFTLDEMSAVRAGKTTYRTIARRNLKSSLRGCLSYLGHRPDGWLLLDTENEKVLAKMVRDSFGQAAVNQMRRTKHLPYDFVKKLVARNYQLLFSPPRSKKD